MTDLRSGLDSLAGAIASPAFDSDLWEQGQRYRRRRRVGNAALAIACVASLLFSFALLRAGGHTEAAPIDPSGNTWVPDRFFRAPPDLPSTGDLGPLGPAIAVQDAEKGRGFSRDRAVAGISATTGEYRLLDLPGYAPFGFDLAPDGRHLAYWVKGPIQGSPYVEPEDGDNDIPLDERRPPERVPSGYAIYDLTTGATVREMFPTRHGIAAERLVWADNDTLALVFAQFPTDGSTGGPERRESLYLRELTARNAVEVTEGAGRGHVLVSSNERGVLVMYADRPGPAFKLIDVARPDSARTIAMSRELGSVVPLLAPDGRTVAEVESGLLVGRIGDRGRVQLRRVPGFDIESHAIGWLDDTRVLVSTEWSEQETSDPRVLAVDIRTGQAQLVTHGRALNLAADLMDSPVRQARRPVAATGSRAKWTLVGVALVGFVVSGTALIRRRRVRP